MQEENKTGKRKTINKKAFTLLRELELAFPLSFKKMLPLEVGSFEKVEAFLREKQGESFDLAVLKRAFQFHCKTIPYLNNVKAEGSKRVNLEGVEVAEVTEEQRADAKYKADAFFKWKEKRLRGLEQNRKNELKSQEKKAKAAKEAEMPKPTPPAKKESVKPPVPIQKAKPAPKQVQVVVKKRRTIVKPED